MAKPKLLIATGNPGKMREYAGLLRDAPFQLVSLADLGITHDVDETGATFEENAVLKASEYASLSGIPTLADDSGLEVDALSGEPGVFSARYGEKTTVKGPKSPLTPLYDSEGLEVRPETREFEVSPESVVADGSHEVGATKDALGVPHSDHDRVNLLLRNLEDVPWERRTARFRCVLAIWTPPSLLERQKRSDNPNTPKGPISPPFVKEGWVDLALPSSKAGASEPAHAGSITLLVGSVAGMIQYEPLGDEGFGYDPVFYLPSYGLTMAQLPLDEKNLISHRANAVGKAARLLSRGFGT